jgi:uncharacterized protein (TIGR02453 family)
VTDSFNCFSEETINFFEDLATNNTKEWFDANRSRYDDFVVSPSKSFVISMGERLKTIAPSIHADPRTNKSLFRINRDVRFSPNKAPYKTNLGILFWEGEGKRMECPGFYMHLGLDSLFLGVGMHQFSKEQLQYYRDGVAREKNGESLSRCIETITSDDGYLLMDPTYKRVPSGYDKEYRYAELLKYSGIAFTWTTGDRYICTQPDFVDICFSRFKKMSPAHKWLKDFFGTG